MVVLRIITCWRPPFSMLYLIPTCDEDCGRWNLSKLLVHCPNWQDMRSHVYLQGDFNSSVHQAGCSLYHENHSHEHHVRSLHMFKWFQCGYGVVHLHAFQFPDFIPSLLVGQWYMFGLCVNMKHGHSSTCQKWLPTVILVLGRTDSISSNQ